MTDILLPNGGGKNNAGEFDYKARTTQEAINATATSRALYAVGQRFYDTSRGGWYECVGTPNTAWGFIPSSGAGVESKAVYYKTINQLWQYKGDASENTATQTPTLNHLYQPTSNGVIFGIDIFDFTKQVLVGNGSEWVVTRIPDGLENAQSIEMILDAILIQEYNASILTIADQKYYRSSWNRAAGTNYLASERLVLPDYTNFVEITLCGTYGGTFDACCTIFDKEKNVIKHTYESQYAGSWGRKIIFSMPTEAYYIGLTYINDTLRDTYKAPEFSVKYYKSAKLESLESGIEKNRLELGHITEYDNSILTIDGYYLSDSGDEIAFANAACTEFIEFDNFDVNQITVPIPKLTYFNVLFYDKDKNIVEIISGENVTWNDIRTIIPVSTAKYMRAVWGSETYLLGQANVPEYKISIQYDAKAKRTYSNPFKARLDYTVPFDRNVTFPAESNHYYRIPNIVFTQDGTMLCVADIRFGAYLTDQSQASICMCRSVDGGQTFTDYQIIIAHTNVSVLDRRQDPTTLIDHETGRIFVFCHKTLDNVVWQDQHTYLDYGQDLVYVYSDDDGLTWSGEISLGSIFSSVPNIVDVLSGVGTGIQMSNGTLVLPIQIKMESSNDGGESGEDGSIFNIQSGMIYSNNGGDNWNFAGGLVPCFSSENNIIEYENGRLITNARGYKSRRRIFYTDDLGATWNKMPSDFKLFEPVANQGSMIDYKVGFRHVGIFGQHQNTEAVRKNYTILATTNYKNWYPIFQLDEYPRTGYSSLNYDRNGNLYLLIEGITHTIPEGTYISGTYIELYNLTSIRDLIFSI